MGGCGNSPHGKSLRPTSVAFRITDRQGHESRVYLVVPRGERSPSQAVMVSALQVSLNKL